ncbi:hypothetical protein BDV06DRAFT_187276 [Aspergillus oleicola]
MSDEIASRFAFFTSGVSWALLTSIRFLDILISIYARQWALFAFEIGIRPVILKRSITGSYIPWLWAR